MGILDPTRGGWHVRVTLGQRPARLFADQAGAIIDEAAREAVALGSLRIWPEMARRVPTGASGALAASVLPSAPVGALGTYTADVGPTGAPAMYAYWADQGRGPGGMPPEQPIAYWAQARLGTSDPAVVYAIRRKIAQRGTTGSRFVDRTVSEAGPDVARAMAALVRLRATTI